MKAPMHWFCIRHVHVDVICKHILDPKYKTPLLREEKREEHVLSQLPGVGFSVN